MRIFPGTGCSRGWASACSNDRQSWGRSTAGARPEGAARGSGASGRTGSGRQLGVAHHHGAVSPQDPRRAGTYCPAWWHRRAEGGRPSLSYAVAPRLDYADVVALFAVHLGGTAAERESRAALVGADLAHRVNVARRRTPLQVTDSGGNPWRARIYRALDVDVLWTGHRADLLMPTGGNRNDRPRSGPRYPAGPDPRGARRQRRRDRRTVSGHRVPDAGHGDCTVNLALVPLGKESWPWT